MAKVLVARLAGLHVLTSLYVEYSKTSDAAGRVWHAWLEYQQKRSFAQQEN